MSQPPHNNSLEMSLRLSSQLLALVLIIASNKKLHQ